MAEIKIQSAESGAEASSSAKAFGAGADAKTAAACAAYADAMQAGRTADLGRRGAGEAAGEYAESSGGTGGKAMEPDPKSGGTAAQAAGSDGASGIAGNDEISRKAGCDTATRTAGKGAGPGAASGGSDADAEKDAENAESVESANAFAGGGDLKGADAADAADAGGGSEAEDGQDDQNSQDSPEGEDAGNDGKKSFFGRKKEKKKDKRDEQIEELTDRLKRQMAEFENFRKRTEKEKSQMYDMGARSMIERILPVIDNFERGLAAVPEEKKDDPFAEGMGKTYKQMMTALEEAGVEAIEAAGKEFDPEFHNAVMHVEDESLGENVVAEELQKGYLYRGTVVRHSMVKVAN